MEKEINQEATESKSWTAKRKAALVLARYHSWQYNDCPGI